MALFLCTAYAVVLSSHFHMGLRRQEPRLPPLTGVAKALANEMQQSLMGGASHYTSEVPVAF